LLPHARKLWWLRVLLRNLSTLLSPPASGQYLRPLLHLRRASRILRVHTTAQADLSAVFERPNCLWLPTCRPRSLSGELCLPRCRSVRVRDRHRPGLVRATYTSRLAAASVAATAF
jgi:hypothetical protein